jgi:hypothetical protein
MDHTVIRSGMSILSLLLGIGLLANAASDQAAKNDALRLLISEVQPSMASSEQICMLVFDDHRFHVEKAHRARGKDRDRKVYEGRLSDGNWNALNDILDAKQFRELRVPPSIPALVVQNSHPYTISVARQKGFQNMEFLTKESLKPYESELKPLLRWWKSARDVHTLESGADVDSRCTLTDADAIFNN